VIPASLPSLARNNRRAPQPVGKSPAPTTSFGEGLLTFDEGTGIEEVIRHLNGARG